MNDVSLYVDKGDALSRIKTFMSNAESGVMLTPNEEKILSRLIYANALLSERKFTTEQVAEKIKEKFGCSIFTARNDINNTYTLFVSITEDYKRYTLWHHVEFLRQKLKAWETDKSLAHLLPKLSDSITKAIAAMPVKPEAPDIPAPIILINVVGGKITAPEMSPDEARKEADEIIKQEEKGEYIDFEDSE